jgi:hypothetical protein
MQTFAEQFAATKGGPIHYDRRELHWTYWLAVNGGDEIALRFLRSADSPLQGIGIKAEKCHVQVANVTAKSLGLWTDTAPKDVLLRVVKAKRGARVGFFNQWRDEKYGSTMYHLNNAAMEIQPQPDGSALLRCSDGWGEPDFNDLVLTLSHRPA